MCGNLVLPIRLHPLSYVTVNQFMVKSHCHIVMYYLLSSDMTLVTSDDVSHIVILHDILLVSSWGYVLLKLMHHYPRVLWYIRSPKISLVTSYVAGICSPNVTQCHTLAVA